MNSFYLKLVKKVAIINLLIFCANCTQPGRKIEAEHDAVPTIDIIGNISNTQKVNLSTIASSIDYCMLETDANCLIIGKNIYGSREYIVSLDGKFCYIFERKTGKFVRQISQIGQGPDDYQFVHSFLNDDKGQICLLGNNQLLFFNLDGTLSHKTNHFSLFDFTAYQDFYVSHITNSRGNATIRVAFYDKTGELIDSIPNNRTYKRPVGISYTIYVDGGFYIFNNSLYYKDIYCDTLYQINDFSLQPRYIFNTGGRTVPYESQIEGRLDMRNSSGGDWDRYAKYIVIDTFFEDTFFLFFTFEYRNMKYPAIYNKAEKKIQVLLPISISQYSFWAKNMLLYGFENDLDGGLPFWPRQMISDKEMMCVYTAEELLKLDASKITDSKLKFVLSNLEEDSNPIIAVVTLKD